MNCPSIGFPYGQQTNDFKGSLMIIVSHSGGTFAPLACSNLLQSFSDNIFVVTSEWDVQIVSMELSLLFLDHLDVHKLTLNASLTGKTIKRNAF